MRARARRCDRAEVCAGNGVVVAARTLALNGTAVEDGRRVRVRLPGDDFARAAFSIWVGPDAPLPKFRDGLLGRR